MNSMASTTTTKGADLCPAEEGTVSLNSSLSSTSATSSSFNCCAQVEQVRTNNSLRLSIAKNEQLVCKAAHKVQKRQEVYDKLLLEFNLLHKEIDTNKATKEEVLIKNKMSAEQLEVRTCESRRMKKQAQNLQYSMKDRKQQSCKLEQQIKIIREDFLAAANTIEQKIDECKNAIENLMIAKSTLDKAVQKSECDLQSISNLLSQSRHVLENILTKFEMYQTQLPALQQEIARTRQAFQQKKQDVASLRANNPRAKMVLEDLLNEAERYRRKAEAVQEAMKTPSCESGRLQEAVEQLTQQRKEAEKALCEGQQKLVTLTEKLKGTEGRWDQAAQELNQTKEIYTSLHERYIGLVREQAC